MSRGTAKLHDGYMYVCMHVCMHIVTHKKRTCGFLVWFAFIKCVGKRCQPAIKPDPKNTHHVNWFAAAGRSACKAGCCCMCAEFGQKASVARICRQRAIESERARAFARGPDAQGRKARDTEETKGPTASFSRQCFAETCRLTAPGVV